MGKQKICATAEVMGSTIPLSDISRIEMLCEKFLDQGWEDLSIVSDYGPVLCIEGYRLETDEEYEARLIGSDFESFMREVHKSGLLKNNSRAYSLLRSYLERLHNKDKGNKERIKKLEEMIESLEDKLLEAHGIDIDFEKMFITCSRGIPLKKLYSLLMDVFEILVVS